MSELKSYGWGIVDKDGEPASSLAYLTEGAKRFSDMRVEQWNSVDEIKGKPFRVVELFYKEDAPR